MGTNEVHSEGQWWAESDTPVHYGDSRVSYYLDGRSALFALCCALLCARSSVYLANWGLTAHLELVRGKEQRAGADGSPEQEALMALLRAEGLGDEEITFWQTHKLTVKEVLGYAVSHGADVKVLLWNSLPLPAYSHYYPRLTCDELSQVGVTCLLDNSARGILHHPAESLHQKLSVIDNRVAFVGGIDPMVEKNHDFDRWDTPAHLFTTELRQTAEGTTPHPWHDVHARIEGPAVADVAYNFRQRWNAVVQRYERWHLLPARRHFYQQARVEAQPVPPAVEQGTEVVQIARTIPKHTYHFRPNVVQGIAQLYMHAIRNAQRFIYLENQYLWVRAYTGLDISFLGRDNSEMEQIMQELINALHRGVSVSVVLPDHPAPGRAFSDASIKRIRAEAPDAVSEGRFRAFCLATSTSQENGEHYRPIYVHAKVAVVDDLWVTVGSANLNNRGLRDDAEINVATLDAGLARGLRLRLWAEHLGLLNADEIFALNTFFQHNPLNLQQPAGAVGLWQNIQNLWQNSQQRAVSPDRAVLNAWHRAVDALQDPIQGMQLLDWRARENLAACTAREPLHGHLVPYLLKDEALQYGLNFREDHGWLEEE